MKHCFFMRAVLFMECERIYIYVCVCSGKNKQHCNLDEHPISA